MNLQRQLSKIFSNPDLSLQIATIVLTLISERTEMDKRIANMSTAVSKIQGMAEIINNTMNSVKVAADAPRNIRRLLEENIRDGQ